MLRSALAIVSSLRLGMGIKETFERKVRSALVITVAGVLLFVAAMWGLVTAHFALLDAGFSAVVASAIVAAALFLASMLTLAALPLVARPHRSRLVRAVDKEGPAGAVHVMDEQVGRMIQQVGPLGILATAFAIGLVAGRRR